MSQNRSSGQKFIARNRAPHVQIGYDVELYGSEKKIELPFIMGVVADLVGKPIEPSPELTERKFLEINVGNLNDRTKTLKPRLAFNVENTLTGEGNLSVELEFESMGDLSPAAVTKKVEPLNELLQARTKLSNSLSYMDGETGAEELIGKALGDSELLKSLAATPRASQEDGQ